MNFSDVWIPMHNYPPGTGPDDPNAPWNAPPLEEDDCEHGDIDEGYCLICGEQVTMRYEWEHDTGDLVARPCGCWVGE